jgi:peptidylprolyl isomerase
MKFLIAITGIALALLASGCGEDDAAPSSSGEAGSSTPASESKDPRIPTVVDGSDPHFATVTAKGRAKPKIDPPDRPPPERFIVRDLRVGTGPVAKRGKDAAIWYTSVDYKTGEEIFGRWPPSRESPGYEPFVVGLATVAGTNEAFNEGLVGMRVGGRRELVIPSELAFDKGAMTYVVELVRVGSKPAAATSSASDPHFATITYSGEGKRAKPQIDPPDLPPSKRLMFRDLKVGTGPIAQRGDDVAVWYRGVKYKTGKQMFIDWPPARPFVIRLGSGGGGEGFEGGVEGMRVGGRREILVPSRMMYGSGALDYVVELARIEPDPKPAP